MRTPIIAGNWKMNKTAREAVLAAKELARLIPRKGREVVVFPPFLSVPQVSHALKGSRIMVGVQNIHFKEKGAYTGEVSAGMAAEFCTHALIGHSERRAYFKESDRTVRLKVRAALGSGLIPVVCVGETARQRDAGLAYSVVSTMVEKALAGLSAHDLSRIVMAYEPVWAIGTGKNATPAIAQRMHRHIRKCIAGLFPHAAESIRILYGGSVKPGNIQSLLSQPDIDGALVGGASLDPKEFSQIAKIR